MFLMRISLLLFFNLSLSVSVILFPFWALFGRNKRNIYYFVESQNRFTDKCKIYLNSLLHFGVVWLFPIECYKPYNSQNTHPFIDPTECALHIAYHNVICRKRRKCVKYKYKLHDVKMCSSKSDSFDKQITGAFKLLQREFDSVNNLS